MSALIDYTVLIVDDSGGNYSEYSEEFKAPDFFEAARIAQERAVGFGGRVKCLCECEFLPLFVQMVENGDFEEE